MEAWGGSGEFLAGYWCGVCGSAGEVHVASVCVRGGGVGCGRRRHDYLFSGLFSGSVAFPGCLGGDCRRLVSAGLLFVGGWLAAVWGDAGFLWAAFSWRRGSLRWAESERGSSSVSLVDNVLFVSRPIL